MIILMHGDTHTGSAASYLCGHFHSRPKAKGSNATKRLRKKRWKSLGMWAGKNKQLIIGSALPLLNPDYFSNSALSWT